MVHLIDLPRRELQNVLGGVTRSYHVLILIEKFAFLQTCKLFLALFQNIWTSKHI